MRICVCMCAHTLYSCYQLEPACLLPILDSLQELSLFHHVNSGVELRSEVSSHLTSPLLSFLLMFLIFIAKPAEGLEHPLCPLKESSLIGTRSRG